MTLNMTLRLHWSLVQCMIVSNWVCQECIHTVCPWWWCNWFLNLAAPGTQQTRIHGNLHSKYSNRNLHNAIIFLKDSHWLFPFNGFINPLFSESSRECEHIYTEGLKFRSLDNMNLGIWDHVSFPLPVLLLIVQTSSNHVWLNLLKCKTRIRLVISPYPWVCNMSAYSSFQTWHVLALSCVSKHYTHCQGRYRCIWYQTVFSSFSAHS